MIKHHERTRKDVPNRGDLEKERSKMTWKTMESAPRDGTEITLTWMEGGKPQEIYPGMRWDRFTGNPLVQDGKGIWAAHSRKTGDLLFTWSEENPDGAPTHWRLEQPENKTSTDGPNGGETGAG